VISISSLEIERKFLVRNDNWRSLAQGTLYRQGYLASKKERTVRVRVAGDRGYLTIKGPVIGIARTEFEYEIPFDDANRMLDELCEKPIIEKIRRKISFRDHIWEVDEFLGENEGLVVAEVELQNENQPIELPDWIGEEVSGQLKYYNSQLAKNPYRKWLK
jgi:CYTH domain-containing protein